MKLVSEEDIKNYEKSTVRGMVEGFIGGTIASSAGFYMLHRRSRYYRSLPLTIKALGFVMVIAPAVAAQAERRGLQYDMEHNWESAGKREMDREEAEALERWNSLTPMQKVGDWALRYRWHLFLAGWATTMGASWMILRRNKTQTFAQKIVQARVYAQGIALAGLLGGAALAQMQPPEVRKEQRADHSWARLLEQQAQEAKEIERARAAHAATHS
ncbi:RCF2_1 [Sanghuangporus vaninii]